MTRKGWSNTRISKKGKGIKVRKGKRKLIRTKDYFQNKLHKKKQINL